MPQNPQSPGTSADTGNAGEKLPTQMTRLRRAVLFLHAPHMKPTTFLVYHTLLDFVSMKEEPWTCFPSKATIALCSGRDIKTVNQAIKELEARGLIRTFPRQMKNRLDWASNLYAFAPLWQEYEQALIAKTVITHRNREASVMYDPGGTEDAWSSEDGEE